MQEFIGRDYELGQLLLLLDKATASLVVLRGRRRIGKSRLADEFARRAAPQKYYYFTGIAPTSFTTAQSERNEFSSQLHKQGFPYVEAKDWNDLFWLLADKTQKGRTIIVFDEISWMAYKDHDFLGKLKNAWDLFFAKNPKLILILCGSISSWIEKNIISSTAFLGRPSLYLNLEELPLADCNKFWGGGAVRARIADYEKLKILAVTGGVPRYLELINHSLTAEENIKRLCFVKDAVLADEFERIFSDIFGRRSEIYRKIVTLLLAGSLDQQAILQRLGKSKSGDLTEHLNDLILAGFISRDHTWSLKSGALSKLSFYRLKDNYVRFYLKYIAPNRGKIQKGIFQKMALSSLAGWESIIGLQFENLVLNNQDKILQLLHIAPEETVFYNPYFQRKTKNSSGCQIDLLIQTKFNCVYVCEVKFSKAPITAEVIDEVQAKIERMKLPRNFSYRPVLIQVNGVADNVRNGGFFVKIINFGELLS